MSRTARWTLALAAVALGGGVLAATAPSGALAGDHPVALSPASPDVGAGFTATGDGCIDGDGQGFMDVTVQNLVLANNTNAPATTDPDGTWSATWDASWGDGEGWYQVLASCAGTSGLGYWASDIFLTHPTVAVQAITLHQGVAPDEVPTSIYGSGSGCPQGNLVLFNGYDSTGEEVIHGNALPAADGTWTMSTVGTLDPGVTWYGGCDHDSTFLDPLYTATASAPTGTTTTTAPGGTTTTTTAPPVTAPAAGAVGATPDFTG